VRESKEREGQAVFERLSLKHNSTTPKEAVQLDKEEQGEEEYDGGRRFVSNASVTIHLTSSWPGELGLWEG